MKFTIYEERTEIYAATIEAASWQEAKLLYDLDDEEIFGDQWEQESTESCELTHIVELALCSCVSDDLASCDKCLGYGYVKVADHIFENGEHQDEIDYGREGRKGRA